MKTSSGALGAVLLAAALILSTSVPALAAPRTPSPIPRRVCLDSGHGGADPGATYGALREKDLTLDIANRLGTLLLNAGAGFSVVMTRTDDRALGNTERATVCNDARADVVLSIHLNGSTDASVDYFQAFYGKRAKDAAFTQAISDSYSLTKPDGTGPLPKHAPTNFASGLLLKTKAPACLAETVFLTNPSEAAQLGDGIRTRQQHIAEQLFNGLRAWYRV